MRYLLISFFRRKGGQIDEMVKTSKRLQESDINTSNVIIDYEEMNIYYKKIYPNIIDQLEKEAIITKNQLSKLKKTK
jgi:hypothetical protein